MVSSRQLAPLLVLLACRSPLPVAAGDAGADGAPPPAIFPGLTLPDDRGGSRLQLSWWTAPGGARVPGGITDSQLGVGCSWAMLEGAGFRCVPSREQATSFSDAECTHPVVVHDPHSCTPVRDYVGVPANTPTCPASTGVRRRGPPLQQTSFYVRTLMGECAMSTRTDSPELYEVGEEVPATTFVGATQVVEPLADGWSRVYLEAEDGSRWARSMRWGDVDCTAVTAADGVLRCLPSAAGSTFSAGLDADCQTRIAEGQSSSCPTDQVFLRDSDDTVCPPHTAVHRASRRLDASYVKVGDTCWPRRDPLRQAYALGEEVAPGQFPEVSRGYIDAPGGLQRQAIRTSAGIYGLSSFWDSPRGFACVAIPARDGTQRCAAGSFLVGAPFFADAQCTRPVTTANPCIFPALLTPVPNACPVRYRIFRVGAVTKVEKPYVRDASDRCVPAGTLLPAAVVFAVEELEPSNLVKLTLGP